MLPASRKRAPWLAAFFAAGSAFVAAGSAPAQTREARAMVDWVIPALPPNRPQTPEQAEEGRKYGRRLPPPEVLQPRLDPALPAYQPRKEKLNGTFRGGSSDVMTVLVQKWFEKFKTYHPEVGLSISPPYAGSLGAVELVKENLDFVFVSRELRPDDIRDFRARFGYAPLSVPVSGGSYRHFGALDAMGFFVHKDNPLEQLTFDQIDAMYSSTRHRGGKPITKWGDLGLSGEWAEKPIKLYGIKPWNGFEEFVRQRILSKGDKRGEWRDDLVFEKVVFPMAKHVAEDRYGIGYSGLAYLDRGVRVLPLVAAAGDAPQAPTYENVALATYPLSRITFFNVNKAPGKPLPPALDEFLRFVLSREGQQVVLDHAAYLPLRGNQTQSSRALLED
jgi:phosphate transport system substrate-binding protein